MVCRSVCDVQFRCMCMRSGMSRKCTYTCAYFTHPCVSFCVHGGICKVCLHVCVCMCACVCVSVYDCLCKCTRMCVRVSTCECVYVFVHGVVRAPPVCVWCVRVFLCWVCTCTCFRGCVLARASVCMVAHAPKGVGVMKFLEIKMSADINFEWSLSYR